VHLASPSDAPTLGKWIRWVAERIAATRKSEPGVGTPNVDWSSLTAQSRPVGPLRVGEPLATSGDLFPRSPFRASVRIADHPPGTQSNVLLPNALWCAASRETS